MKMFRIVLITSLFVVTPLMRSDDTAGSQAPSAAGRMKAIGAWICEHKGIIIGGSVTLAALLVGGYYRREIGRAVQTRYSNWRNDQLWRRLQQDASSDASSPKSVIERSGAVTPEDQSVPSAVEELLKRISSQQSIPEFDAEIHSIKAQGIVLTPENRKAIATKRSPKNTQDQANIISWLETLMPS